MKSIALLVPSLQAGGMQRVMAELANYFAEKKDTTIHLVLYANKKELFYPISKRVIIHKPDFKFGSRFRFYYAIRMLFFIRKKINKIDPSTILSFGEYWNNYVLIALIFLNKPVFISDRCSPEKEYGLFHTLLRRWLYPLAKGVIAQTEKAKEIYSAQYELNDIVVIGNPIREISNIGPLKRENIVLNVGRLIESKHHDKLIELFAKISLPGWKLVIVGDDAIKQKNMEKLKKIIHKLQMDERVILTGSKSDIDQYYLQSKIFAFTSSSEGFPNVIGEAMSAGLPVISFDCIAGPSEMVSDWENGFLIKVFDFDSFAQKLQLLMQQEILRQKYGKAAKNSIKEFNINVIGERYYKYILNNEKSS